MTYIHDGTRDATIRNIAADYVSNDVIPCLTQPGEPSPVDLPKYRDVVLDRFSNDGHRRHQPARRRRRLRQDPRLHPADHPRAARCAAKASPRSRACPRCSSTFLRRWHQGRLPFKYQDQAMVPERAHAICDAVDPLDEFVADKALWGELAGSARA